MKRQNSYLPDRKVYKSDSRATGRIIHFYVEDLRFTEATGERWMIDSNGMILSCLKCPG